MTKKTVRKNIWILVLPLLLFAVLPVPYSWFNRQYLVKWLGCGCPKLDDSGNMIASYFSANSFTEIFWLGIALCATVCSVFLTKRIPGARLWQKAAYAAVIFLISVLLAYLLTQQMMWT